MPIDIKKLRDAILNISPEDNDGWTESGLPRLDVLSKAIGETVSRTSAERAEPDYNRDEAYIEHDVPPPSVVGGDIPSDGLNNTSKIAIDDGMPLQETEKKRAERLESENENMELAEIRLNESATALNIAQEEFNAAQLEFNSVIESVEKKNRHETSLADANANYFAARDAEMEAGKLSVLDSNFGGLGQVPKKRPKYPSKDSTKDAGTGGK